MSVIQDYNVSSTKDCRLSYFALCSSICITKAEHWKVLQTKAVSNLSNKHIEKGKPQWCDRKSKNTICFLLHLAFYLFTGFSRKMGKKAQKPAASTIEETPHTGSIENQQQYDTKRRKMRSMAVLGEYMRYFGGVNGLYRNIVHMQAEVVSKHGRNGWRRLSPDDQDKAFDKHFVNKFVATDEWNGEASESEDSKENKEISGSKEKSKSRRDSLQSVTVS